MSQSPSVGTLRSALKSNPLNSGAQASQPSGSGYAGRDRRPHRRSVSFSDGRLDGPILGLGDSTSSADTQDNDQAVEGDEDDEVWLEQSTRTNRVLRDLQGLALEDSRTISSSALQFNGDDADASSGPRHSFSRLGPDTSSSHSMRVTSVVVDVSPSAFPVPPGRPLSHEERVLRTQTNTPNVTRGTAMSAFPSFSLARSALIRALTDVVPFIPYWDTLREVDLTHGRRGQKLESLVGLEDCCPVLVGVRVANNALTYLTGLPRTVLRLDAAHNQLSETTSFGECCARVEALDVRGNRLAGGADNLAPLQALRTLDASKNRLTSVAGLQRLRNLVRLDLHGNRIEGKVQIGDWPKLEYLNLSDNKITHLEGLERMPALVVLDIDNNDLAELVLPRGALTRLRILRLSGNARVRRVDGVDRLPSLRVFYADGTASGSSARRWPVKLENLSLRNQCRERGAARKRRDAVDLMALTSDVRDVKRLYLSGNAISYSPVSRAVPCYSLVYLELAACRLTALPDAFAGLFPNVRVLNLNYNFLADPEAAKLRGLVRLRRLSMVGGRVGDAKVLVGIVSGMHEVESVDFRMNPCTLGWYLPLLVKDVPGALSPSAAGEWAEMDAKFRRDLPDEAYIGRLAYRGLMMQRCGQLRTLDGVGVTEKESRKAGRLLSAVRGAGTAGTGAAGGGGSGSAAATAAGAGTTAGTGPGRA
ncbi:L domain-like protein [Schizophyllum commune]